MKSQFFLLFPTFLDDKCNLKSNESCEDCVRDGCTYCSSEKACVTFSLVNDTLNNKCEDQDWYFKQCSVNGKFLLIALPIAIFVALTMLACCCYCCCCKGSACGECLLDICCCCCNCCRCIGSGCGECLREICSCCCNCCRCIDSGCGQCLRLLRHICCCCCCDKNRSSFSGEYHGLLGGVKNPMTQSAASRIQSATARLYGGVKKGSFSSRAQSTADRRAYWGIY